ncbi:MAG: hypothetical protein ABW189_01575 [Rickettsiales bacterium]
MTAFNFKPRFVADILAGRKISTIRKTRRCGVGERMQFFTGQRTKACVKIAEAECVGVAPVTISDERKISLSVTRGEGSWLPSFRLSDKEGLFFRWEELWKQEGVRIHGGNARLL